jgi:hypothetical protein
VLSSRSNGHNVWIERRHNGKYYIHIFLLLIRHYCILATCFHTLLSFLFLRVGSTVPFRSASAALCRSCTHAASDRRSRVSVDRYQAGIDVQLSRRSPIARAHKVVMVKRPGPDGVRRAGHGAETWTKGPRPAGPPFHT